jgi:hypothetical protein
MLSRGQRSRRMFQLLGLAAYVLADLLVSKGGWGCARVCM